MQKKLVHITVNLTLYILTTKSKNAHSIFRYLRFYLAIVAIKYIFCIARRNVLGGEFNKIPYTIALNSTLGGWA